MATARDIMTGGAECVGENETLVEAARKMRDFHVGALPICGEDNRLKGMLPAAVRAALRLHALQDQHPDPQRVDGDLGDLESLQVVQQPRSLLHARGPPGLGDSTPTTVEAAKGGPATTRPPRSITFHREEPLWAPLGYPILGAEVGPEEVVAAREPSHTHAPQAAPPSTAPR